MSSNNKDDLPSLQECVNSIKSICSDKSSKSGAKDAARQFTSCLGFLTHIHLDRITIEQNGRDAFPSPYEIPAVSILMNDRELFLAFLSMLRSKNLGIDTRSHSSQIPMITKTGSFGLKKSTQSGPVNSVSRMAMKQNIQHANGENRKRPLGASAGHDFETTPGKKPKIIRSPHADRSDFYIKATTGLGSKISMPSLQPNILGSSPSIGINFAVLAAMTFYSAFQYLDQWPAILVKAFAEDSFGSRLWIDDERCKLLVQNLNLAFTHSNGSTESKCKPEDGDKYSKNCNIFLGDLDENCTQENPPHQPAHIDTTNSRIRTMSIDAAKLINAANDPQSDSDSGDEEEITSGSAVLPRKRKRNEENDASSSSGEEAIEEEVLVLDASSSKMTEVINKKNPTKSGKVKEVSPFSSQSNKISKLSDWWCQEKVDLSRVRPRFYGANKMLANSMIGSALHQRLDVKVKQNSSLLSSLPAFTSVPAVRKIASSNLEKWLQSPALSGLARNLLSHIVSGIEHTDPPLKEDVSTITNILSMKLKANQFNAHVENVIEIVKNVPTAAICHQVVLYLLREELKIASDEEIQVSTDISGELKMLEAVLTSMTPNLAYGCLASALLSIITGGEMQQRKPSIAILCDVLGSITNLLGAHYDGYLLVNAMMNHSNCKTTKSDFFLIGRLVFECIILMVPTSTVNSIIHQRNRNKANKKANNGMTILESEGLDALSKKLLDIRKTILRWCLSSYRQFTNEERIENVSSAINGKKSKMKVKLNEPIFKSILDGDEDTTEKRETEDSFFTTMKCLLFLVNPESHHMCNLLQVGFTKRSKSETETETLTEEKLCRMQVCMEFGSSIDNDMFRIIIESVTSGIRSISAKDAISLIEQLLNQCSKSDRASFLVDDCNVIWDLYKLTEYKPNLSHSNINIAIPKLACPGLWWRTTVIALILCGKSPQKLGAEIWRASPTIHALIKMVTSGKFRFPTADCDDAEREKMKAAENSIKEREFEIAEILFLPSSKKSSVKPAVEPDFSEVSKKGSRASARQREKQARMLAIKKEEERAREMAEANRRKQKLRRAQKSIMILNPRSVARRPRKEAVQLLFSVNSMFNLSQSFKACVEPDFILLAIGSTSRDSIERAYDWLIPTISSSAGIINRLPPSASCFLLLRAYGAEGSENSQLLDLSSPLLKHVSYSLTGDFGRDGAQRAADILFFDLADDDPDRRRCARRVLQESLGKIHRKADSFNFAEKFSWLIALTESKYAISLVSNAIPRLLHALDFERGQVLRAYIMAMDYYKKMDLDVHKIDSFDLSSSICNLLSTRSKICIAAMDRYDDLQSMLIHIVCSAFKSRLASLESDLKPGEIGVTLSICNKDEDVLFPLSLIRASLVLISSWNEKNIPTNNELMYLVEHFIPTQSNGERIGAANASFATTKKLAISVENWVMLAKSHCDLIAKRSVLAVPDTFLPRLLLCCGLPRSSFITIIERLDKVGDSALDKNKCFRQLLSSSATGEWGVLKRNTIARMLLGRISAYTDLLQDSGDCKESVLSAIASSYFISWLESECRAVKKKLSSKKRARIPQVIDPSSAIAKILQEDKQSNVLSSMPSEDSYSQLSNLEELKRVSHECEKSCLITKETLERVCGEGNFEKLDGFLQEYFDKYCMEKRHSDRDGSILDKISSNLVIVHRSMNVQPSALSRLILHWVPILTKESNSAFWVELFHRDDKIGSDAYDFKNILLTQCMSSWSRSQVSACQLWILNEVKFGRTFSYCIKSLLKCFLHKISNVKFSNTGNNKKLLKPHIDVLGPKDQTESAVKLALLGAQEWSNESNGMHRKLDELEWMAMLLLIGGVDKKHLDLMAGIIISNLPSDSWEGKVLPGTLLKIYATYPTNMNLPGKIRDVLVKASGEMSHQWLRWETPLDHQFLSAVSSLSIQSVHRQQHAIFDLTKKHPLIAVKYLSKIASVIIKDAEVLSSFDGEAKVRHSYEQLPLLALSENKEIRVKVFHWGMSFTESLWYSILDVIASFPDKVIYSIGWAIGLETIFDSCLKLFAIQFDVSGDTQRLRKKFISVFQGFRSCNNEACNEWLGKLLLRGKSVKEILIKCGMPVDDSELSREEVNTT